MRNRTALLLSVPLFLGSFGAAYGLSALREPSLQVGRLMELIRSDPEGLVCDGGADCINPNAALHALLFYRADDCSIGLYFVSQVEALYRSTDRVTLNLVGVGTGTDPDDARLLARASAVTYPLYTRPPRISRLAPDPRTPLSNKPVLVLADPGGRIVRTIEADATVAGQREQLRSMLDLIEELTHERS